MLVWVGWAVTQRQAGKRPKNGTAFACPPLRGSGPGGTLCKPPPAPVRTGRSENLGVGAGQSRDNPKQAEPQQSPSCSRGSAAAFLSQNSRAQLPPTSLPLHLPAGSIPGISSSQETKRAKLMTQPWTYNFSTVYLWCGL